MLKVDLKNIHQLLPWFAAREATVASLIKEVANRVAQEFLSRLQREWQSQSSPLAPLGRAYREAKGRAGLDQRILIATGDLLAGLQVFPEQAAGNNAKVVVGFPAGARHSSGMAMADLMTILEYGSPSRGLPARPIFFLTRLKVEGELVRMAQDELQRGLRARGW